VSIVDALAHIAYRISHVSKSYQNSPKPKLDPTRSRNTSILHPVNSALCVVSRKAASASAYQASLYHIPRRGTHRTPKITTSPSLSFPTVLIYNMKFIVPSHRTLARLFLLQHSTKYCFALANSMTTETATCTSNSVPTSIEDVSPSYLQLTTKLKLVSQLRRVSSVVDYDRTVFMPQSDECAADRGAQMAALAQVIHEKATDKEIGMLIERALKDLEASSVDEFQEERRVLELSKKSFEKNDRISAELEARKAKLSSESYGMWTKARAKSDYSMFEPYLKNCFDVAMEVADAQRDDDSVPLYTQMLDDYETGMSAERIDEIFDEIKKELVPLISLVLGDTATAPSTDPLKGEFPVEKQQVMNEQIVTSIGYDKNFGRIDVSVHPFTSSLGAHDVRITSR